MKNLFYLLIALPIILQSCVDQASDDIVFTIFNQTDKNVKILAFVTKNEITGKIYDTPFNANEITINPNSNYKVTRVTGMDDNTGMSFYSLENGGIDSVRVIFNNEKIKIYTRTPPNPCDICDGDENHQHFITENDYNSAEDCNGNCD